MKVRILLLLPLALVALAAAAGQARAQSCTPINVLPYTITQPGTYCLTGTQSPLMFSGTAITIAADDVVLDLGGYAIDNLNAGASTSAIAISMPQDQWDVTIQNGAIRGFDKGVRLGLQFARTMVVENMRFEHCYQYPISVNGYDLMIRSNFISNTGGSTFDPNGSVIAIAINGFGSGLRILDNDIANTLPPGTGAAFAIGINATPNPGAEAVIEGNRISNLANPLPQQTYGIVLQNTSTAFVIGNHISGAFFGILYEGGAVGKFRDNVTFNVSQPFFGGTNGGGNT
jgi:parallel beta helix pectate lyase-like protein